MILFFLLMLFLVLIVFIFINAGNPSWFTPPAPFFLRFLAAYPSHHRCNECGKVCWIWQDCTRPSEAYHEKCFDKKYNFKRNKWLGF